ncbi:hypothetical protein [Synechococcus sp. WH 8020]|uniref:hypothetical protein n=1 Tax=Synechococcus sp. (strain WH8020) TaxID=32052 RepID=UPI000A5C9A89|nr:hypothetical protein [Synechococcus sp. WH 8020]
MQPQHLGEQRFRTPISAFSPRVQWRCDEASICRGADHCLTVTTVRLKPTTHEQSPVASETTPHFFS